MARVGGGGLRPGGAAREAARVFWPDKHGTAGRQLGAALRERKPALETAAGLEGQSAGLQSLAALEQLLYPDGAADDPEADRFACRYALAIADFQARLAAEMAASFASQPQDGAATAEGLFTGMRTTLDTVIALDLERPLGADIATARGERARAWRSGLSLPLIAVALDTVERVYTAPGGFASMIRASAELSAFDAVLGAGCRRRGRRSKPSTHRCTSRWRTRPSGRGRGAAGGASRRAPAAGGALGAGAGVRLGVQRSGRGLTNDP